MPNEDVSRKPHSPRPMTGGSLYKTLLRPALFTLDPERIHHIAMAGLKGFAHLPWHAQPDPRLAREVFGIRFPTPIGLAAGFDKNAIALPAWEKLGFGFVEAGTITAAGQPGNPRPRIFRLSTRGFDQPHGLQ